MSMSIKNREKLTSLEKKQEILAALAGQDINNCWSLPFGNVSGGGYRELSMYLDGRQIKIAAHRAVYAIFYGAIGKGLVLDHLCHNDAHKRGECDGSDCKHRQCVNPTHLQAKTHKENVSAGARNNDNRGTCRKGHAWIKENILVRHTGRRVCNICHTASTKRSVERKKVMV